MEKYTGVMTGASLSEKSNRVDDIGKSETSETSAGFTMLYSKGDMGNTIGTYKPNIVKGKENELSLSMKIINQPSRSGDLLAKSSDPTKINSILNSHTVTDNDTDSIDTEEEIPRSPESNSSPNKGSPTRHILVRKKSGEILKPSIKDSSNTSYFDKKRSKSLPTTPTYKQVHFGGDTDVRYFKRKDRPTAISASNSPTLEGCDESIGGLYLDSDEDDYNDEDDIYGANSSDYNEDNFKLDLSTSGSTNFPKSKDRKAHWSLNLTNFPPLSYDEKIKTENSLVFLERIFITIDKKYVLGHIAVKNIAFEKSVTVRYTLDKWCTIVEIPTVYVPEIPKILKENNYDRFIFQIPLDSLFNSFRMPSINIPEQRVHEKSYSFCIKYNSGNLEFWDNNRFNNYDFKLVKTMDSSVVNNSKIQTHTSRPKYSSSYLKRRASDSNLQDVTKVTEEGPGEVSTSDFSSNNDFVKNDFYLLSPLLSSLHNSLDGNDILPNYSTDTLSSYTTQSKNFNERENESFDFESKQLKENKDPNNGDNNPFKSSSLDSKSYQELLDTYCFFSTSPKENNSIDTPLEEYSGSRLKEFDLDICGPKSSHTVVPGNTLNLSNTHPNDDWKSSKKSQSFESPNTDKSTSKSDNKEPSSFTISSVLRS